MMSADFFNLRKFINFTEYVQIKHLLSINNLIRIVFKFTLLQLQIHKGFEMQIIAFDSEFHFNAILLEIELFRVV